MRFYPTLSLALSLATVIFIFFFQMGNGNSKEKDAALKSLNAHLGRNQGFLCAGRFTLADLAVLSALLGARSNFKSLPKNAKAWFQTMASIFNLNNFDVPSAWVSS